ncbi:HIT domain-containing protein [Texas Phoenix palm phytoplasma]|uniref:HIT domain-containing protein n=1 Tax=Texas Phoenix palm phytoplasma TaxID=176709 RepID=A0ABS5BIN6_9MOLU|nr:HIT domain-containing protein [Texas Phoenix palm phytoplasma]MBP3059437.1 HIT domain-containing protein [Texas Phoenix palm phytoplasma]
MINVFQKIIDKKIPSYIIYEDEIVIVFLDKMQATKGHTLVVTKKPYIDIEEVPRDVFVYVFKIVHKISKILLKTFNAKGINLLNNNGIISGQTIFHFHVHLIPRFNKNEVNFSFKDNSHKLTSKEYYEIQNKIIVNLLKK